MARFKSFANGGTLLPADLNSIEDDYEFAFGTYKMLFSAASVGPGSLTAGTYIMPQGSGSVTTVPATVGNTGLFYIDPADYLANTRSSKLRFRGQVYTNAVAPAITITFGLYPIGTFGGASGLPPTVATLGTVVTGSTVAIASPSASAQTQGNSGDFTFPTAGYYLMAYVLSGSGAANSKLDVSAQLELRQV